MHHITTSKLGFEKISEIISANKKLTLSAEVKTNIVRCREYLDKRTVTQKEPIYGINTGFGSLCDVIIPHKDLEKLQRNLVMSHACGTGDEVPQACDITKFRCSFSK